MRHSITLDLRIKSIHSLLSICAMDTLNSTNVVDLREQTERLSAQLEESFVTTYSSLQLILSQVQMKLAAVFLQETEYLRKRENQLEQNEDVLQQRLKSLNEIQAEREELQKEFGELQNRLESAIVHVIHFQTDGSEILRVLFGESRQIDEEISGLISQCLSSLDRSRTMIDWKIDQFSHQSAQIQSVFIEQERSIVAAQSTIGKFFEYLQQLNQINLEHSTEIHTSNIEFEKSSQQILDASETSENPGNLRHELADIHRLEMHKRQLEKELLEQTILLENISTVIGKSLD